MVYTRRYVATLIVAALVCSLGGTVSAGNAFYYAELEAENPNPAAYDSFGWDVAMGGRYAVVGSPWLDADPAQTGYAHVYHKGEDGLWSHQTSLVPAGTFTPGDVGIGVGIYYADESNVRIITGNRADATATVWKWTETTWAEESTWLGDFGSTFGSAARIHANHVVIGANGDDKMYTARFNGTNWSSMAQLDTTGAGSFGDLGYRVDIDEDWIVGGAYSTNSQDGAVLFWKRNADTANWDYHSRIDAQTGSAGYFGISCDLNCAPDDDPDGDDRVIVGARAYDGGDGKAFIYKYNTDTDAWEQEAAIDGDNGSGELFGSAVSLDGDTAVIGAYGADVDSHTDAGAAYLYTFDGEDWNLQTKLTADEPVAGQTFGSAVDADGNSLLIGGPYRQGDRHHGVAYLFESAIPGDANLDGQVDDQDASILAAHWQQSEMNWGDGDFNDDGCVNDQDASILASHWQEGVPEGTAPVPEPATAVLLVGLLLPLVLRRVRVSFR